MFSESAMLECERPYEKLMINGASKLTTEELLAIILQNGHKGKSSLDLAEDLLRHEMIGRNLRQLATLESQDFREIKGIGTAKAARLCACIELANRINSADTQPSIRNLSSPEAVYKYVWHITSLTTERLLLLLLDCHNSLLRECVIKDGSLYSVKFENHDILRQALRYNCHSAIIVHNHPSGDAAPSEADKCATRRLVLSLAQIDVILHDHLVVTSNGYTSMRSDFGELFALP